MRRRAAPGCNRAAVFCGAFGLAWCPTSPASPPAEIVAYRDDFNGRPGVIYPGWSSSPILCERRGRGRDPGRETRPAPAVAGAESPNGRRRFLGEFGGPAVDPAARTRVRQTIRLQLEGLPPHNRASLSCDLLILRSCDGDSPAYGPDRWTIRVAGGPTLLDATFSNNPKTDSDKSFQSYPAPGSRPQVGASAVKALGFGFFGDSAYPLNFTFPHTSDTMTLEFSSDLFEGKGTDDESWGLDDVTILLDPDKPRTGRDWHR